MKTKFNPVLAIILFLSTLTIIGCQKEDLKPLDGVYQVHGEYATFQGNGTITIRGNKMDFNIPAIYSEKNIDFLGDGSTGEIAFPPQVVGNYELSQVGIQYCNGNQITLDLKLKGQGAWSSQTFRMLISGGK